MFRRLLKRALGRVSPATIERLAAFPVFEHEWSAIRSTPSFPAREQLWADLLVKAGAPSGPICYLEFGVHRGESIRFFAEHHAHPENRFYGFDSFEGLPEDWGAFGAKGHFSTNGATPDNSDARVMFVKGWFNKTLEPFLACTTIGERTVIVHFDADLFSSTLYVLSVLAQHVPDYYFVFDEFIGDEARALHEACRAFGLEVEFYGHTPVSGGGYPMQVSGRLTRH